eukprot:jgi/Phyca11/533026/estExt2_fgenesh1_pg.C_PHYCAscaffold_100006
MEGKRGNDTDDNVDAKRAKTEFPLELVLNGEEYINLALLFKTTPFDAYFNKHYKTVKRFLEKETKNASTPIAPLMIDDIGFFQDAIGKKHQVEMRGDRTARESHKVELEQKNVEIEKKNVELEKKNVELEKKNVEVEKKNAEIEKKHAKSVSAEKDITILQMKNNALDMKNSEQAQRIKELEDQLRRYSKNQVHPM